jgi:hypothetical protein
VNAIHWIRHYPAVAVDTSASVAVGKFA